MADLTGLRSLIDGIADKVATLQAAVQALLSAPDVIQSEIDDLRAKAQTISDQLDALIAEAGGTDGTTTTP